MPGHSELPSSTAPSGELVVQGGRMDGARRALGDPLTLIGSSVGCDIRLGVQGVAPIQCAIILGPDGPLLRDLASGGCKVNGQQAKQHRLAGGDLLEFGPFQFRVEIPPPRTDEVTNALAAAVGHEMEGLRIQAAAVAAQQAALVEQEARLGHRAAALQRQESQLAAHLESRQAQLDEVQRSQQLAQEQLAAERAALDASIVGARQELEAAARQRERLAKLRRRLVKRSRRQAAEVLAAKLRHDQERERFLAWHAKANGEVQLLKRQLQDERRELSLDQQRWEVALNEEKAERLRRDREQAERAAELLSAREALAAEQHHWRQHQANLARETKGLESRIAAQRQQLSSLEREVAGLREAISPTPIEPPAQVPAGPSPERWPERLRQVAGWLGDQRLRLLEQWETFLTVQNEWEQARDTAMEDIDRTARHLEDRDHSLAQAERVLQSRQSELSQRRQAIEARGLALEGMHARLTLAESAWRSERERVAGTLAAAEQAGELRRRQYDLVHQRRNELRKRELASLREALARADEARRQYWLAWQAAEQSGPAERALEPARERERLDALAAVLSRREADLAERALVQQREAETWEAARMAAAAEEQVREIEGRQRRGWQAIAERELAELRVELERLAVALMEDGGRDRAEASSVAA